MPVCGASSTNVCVRPLGHDAPCSYNDASVEARNLRTQIEHVTDAALQIQAENEAARNNIERVVAILTPLFVKAQEADSPDEEALGGALDVLTGWFGQNGKPLRKIDELEAENARLREAAQRVLTCADTDECGHEWWTGECLLLLRHELAPREPVCELAAHSPATCQHPDCRYAFYGSGSPPSPPSETNVARSLPG